MTFPAQHDCLLPVVVALLGDAALARLHYESDRAAQMLGWRPRVGVREGIKQVQPAP